MNAKLIGLSTALTVLALAAGTTLAAPTSLPAGDYGEGGIVLHFGADGTWSVSQGAKAMVEGTWKSTDTTVELTDVSGPFACPAASKTGSYTWRFDGKDLTLAKANDACDGRSDDLAGHPWRKK
jgi:hypothetical protein